MLHKYPGGKGGHNGWRTREYLAFAPYEFTEFRDPCCGNCPWLWEIDTGMPRWINDLDTYMYAYFVSLRDDPTFADRWIERLRSVCWSRQRVEDEFFAARDRLQRLVYRPDLIDGVDVLFCRRLSHRQLMHHGRKTLCSPSLAGQWKELKGITKEKISRAHRIMQGVEITNQDYSSVMTAPTDGVAFTMIDPPYFLVHHGSRIYGYEWFDNDHIRCRDLLLSLDPRTHKVMLTIDGSEAARDIYCGHSGLHVIENIYYSAMSSNKERKWNEELIVRNYDD